MYPPPSTVTESEDSSTHVRSRFVLVRDEALNPREPWSRTLTQPYALAVSVMLPTITEEAEKRKGHVL